MVTWDGRSRAGPRLFGYFVIPSVIPLYLHGERRLSLTLGCLDEKREVKAYGACVLSDLFEPVYV